MKLVSPAFKFAQCGIKLSQSMGMYSVIINKDGVSQVNGWCKNTRVLTKPPDQVTERCREERVPGWQSLSLLFCGASGNADLRFYILCEDFEVSPRVDSLGMSYVRLKAKSIEEQKPNAALDLRFGQSQKFMQYLDEMEYWQMTYEIDPKEFRYPI